MLGGATKNWTGTLVAAGERILLEEVQRFLNKKSENKQTKQHCEITEYLLSLRQQYDRNLENT